MRLLTAFVLGGATGLALRRPLKRATVRVLKHVVSAKRTLQELANEAEQDLDAEQRDQVARGNE